MSTATETIEGLVQKEYKYGFYTDVETDSAPPGLNEDIIRFISGKMERKSIFRCTVFLGIPLASPSFR